MTISQGSVAMQLWCGAILGYLITHLLQSISVK